MATDAMRDPLNEPARRTIPELLADSALIQAALDRAFEEVVRQHIQADLPMASGQDGKVVWTSAKEILARLKSEPSH